MTLLRILQILDNPKESLISFITPIGVKALNKVNHYRKNKTSRIYNVAKSKFYLDIFLTEEGLHKFIENIILYETKTGTEIDYENLFFKLNHITYELCMILEPCVLLKKSPDLIVFIEKFQNEIENFKEGLDDYINRIASYYFQEFKPFFFNYQNQLSSREKSNLIGELKYVLANDHSEYIDKKIDYCIEILNSDTQKFTENKLETTIEEKELVRKVLEEIGFIVDGKVILNLSKKPKNDLFPMKSLFNLFVELTKKNIVKNFNVNSRGNKTRLKVQSLLDISISNSTWNVKSALNPKGFNAIEREIFEKLEKMPIKIMD